MKLIQWWLVHRVPIDVLITPEIEATACNQFKIPLAAWEEAKKRFPSLLSEVNQKRLRRMEYFLATGNLAPNGWTPPGSKEPLDTERTALRIVLEALSSSFAG